MNNKKVYGKGITKRGIVSKTPMQTKKHVSQMTVSEKLLLASELKDIKSLTKSRHLNEKEQNGEITLDKKDVMDTVHGDTINNIIEYNEVKNTFEHKIHQRVLLKLNHPVNLLIDDKIQLCKMFVVIELDTNKIITCYPNLLGDNHENINLKRYKKNMRVRRTVKNGIAI